VGNTGCNPEGREEKADLGRKKKGESDGAAHWREELEGRLRYP
jgi:hypothetical protein